MMVAVLCYYWLHWWHLVSWDELGTGSHGKDCWFSCFWIYITCVLIRFSCVWPHGLEPARLFSLWDFPGKNTGVGCHFLLQGIFLTQGSNQQLLHLLHWQAGSLPRVPPGWSVNHSLRSDFCKPTDCSLPGSSVHGVPQARILESLAIPFSRGSSWPKDRTQVSCIAARFFTIWTTGKHHLEGPQ